MKLLTGFIIGFYLGLVVIYLATNQNKPTEKVETLHLSRFYGNTDTIHTKEKKVPLWDKYTEKDIINNNY